MKYTVRFAHLENAPEWKVGDKIKSGDVIGKIGTSGQSTAKHLHIDCVEGHQVARYQLKDIEDGSPKACPRQMNWFIDNELFKQPIVITTYYADPKYQLIFKKVHSGYDVVPQNRHEKEASLLIYWNRSIDGKVLRVDYDPNGYGNCIYVGFES